jgi:hypothetical protein
MGTVVRPKGMVQTDSNFAAVQPLSLWSVETAELSNAWYPEKILTGKETLL